MASQTNLRLLFPQEPSQKISSRSVQVLFRYRGNRQTDRQTYAGDSIILAFAGIIKHCISIYAVIILDQHRKHYKIPEVQNHNRNSIYYTHWLCRGIICWGILCVILTTNISHPLVAYLRRHLGNDSKAIATVSNETRTSLQRFLRKV